MPVLWNTVAALEGKTLFTLKRKNPFVIVKVEPDRVRLFPKLGKGDERTVPREQIEHLAGLGLQREELRKGAERQYPNSQDTSYLAAITCEVTGMVERRPGEPQMSATMKALGIDRLSAAERLLLAEEIWDSIGEDEDAAPLTPAQTDDLKRRIAEYEANPNAGSSWEDVKARLKGRS